MFLCFRGFSGCWNSSWNSLLSQGELTQHSWPVVFIGFSFILGALPNVLGAGKFCIPHALYQRESFSKLLLLSSSWAGTMGRCHQGKASTVIPAAGHHLEVTSVFNSGLNLLSGRLEVTSVFKCELNLLSLRLLKADHPNRAVRGEFAHFGPGRV